MKLRELHKYVADRVCLYEERGEGFDYKDLYIGELMNAPSELLEREVRIIGAKRKSLLDIELRV